MILRLNFGATEVYVSTTSALLRLLEATHRRHCIPPGTHAKGYHPHRSVSVRLPPPERSPEFALRTAQREIATEVASSQGWFATGAVVVERDGRALAVVGRPGCGKSTIAAHLLARGWRLVSDDVAFLDLERTVVVGHHGLMSFRSGSIPHLPSAFKATLERSRWFVGEDGELQFYEVDPASAFGAAAWSEEAVLDAIVLLDDGASGLGVETLERGALDLPGFDRRPATLDSFIGLRFGAIGKDRASRTADRIEQWYDAHVDA